MSKQLENLLSLPKITELRAELYKRSFYEFVLESFKVIHNGKGLDENWHIKYLCDKLQQKAFDIVKGVKRDKHLLINVPPRTLKSELVNVFFSAYLWVLKSDVKFISCSYSSSLSISLSVQSRRLIESDWFKEHFPLVEISKDENTKSKFTNTNGGLRYCTSTGGTVTGMGGDVIVVDDPQNPQLARSEVERDNANNFFNETLRSRLNDPEYGVFIVIMQRLHENDLTGMLLNLEPENWEHICLPAEKSINIKPPELSSNYVGGLLFPKRLNEKTLNQFKLGLGSYGYSGQYEQLPSPSDGGIIKSKWFNIIDDIKDDEGNVISKDKLVWNFFIDTAYTTKQSNDPSALLSCSLYNRNLYIRDVSEVRLEFPELIKEIKSYTIRNGYSRSSRVYVEPKASGKSIVQQLKSDSSINVIESKNPDVDKVSRANSSAPTIEAGKVFLMKGSWNSAFTNQCNSFPNSTHDDMVDVLVMAIDELMGRSDFVFV